MRTATSRAHIVFAGALIAGLLLAGGPGAHRAHSEPAMQEVTADRGDDLFADAFKEPGGSILSQVEDEAVFAEETEEEPSPIPAPDSSWMLLSALVCFALAGWRAAAQRRG
jgi:hypothetical protein